MRARVLWVHNNTAHQASKEGLLSNTRARAVEKSPPTFAEHSADYCWENGRAHAPPQLKEEAGGTSLNLQQSVSPLGFPRKIRENAVCSFSEKNIPKVQLYILHIYDYFMVFLVSFWRQTPPGLVLALLQTILGKMIWLFFLCSLLTFLWCFFSTYKPFFANRDLCALRADFVVVWQFFDIFCLLRRESAREKSLKLISIFTYRFQKVSFVYHSMKEFKQKFYIAV